ncbi:FKBP-type peptidyl-prolyl cis-trans isomerase [Parvicella tangerina]|uniref:Peptidyl-prolyl cis-trans isomerase n=1 Tax=Parvicella tangerina TaxID=2829795 RepID=A0A916JQ73_9FLAO|nr:FKBP-type peptidyl-prolyl cis-trans isomerase [Parvicella tangerina]CAG5084187.1 putative FKBP-type peptidyl-prolyl cis-trans isomerase FkpA [Parvicella tangerina]
MSSRIVLIMLVAVVFLGSCRKRKVRKQAEVDEVVITDYLRENNIDATATGSGLYYIIDSIGTGAYPTADGSVTAYYKGYFIDGDVFDQSPGSGSNFSLRSVIPGWTEGLQLFPEGSTGRLFIPSHLGYGLDDYGDIPGGSVLIFDIELLDVL